MKKPFIAVALFLAICFQFAACDVLSERADKNQTDEGIEKLSQESVSYDVYLDFDFEENLFLAIYDIEIYLDEEYVGVIEHGKTFTKQISITEGHHVFTFYKETDNKVSATKKFDVDKECSVRCTLHSNSSSIEVKRFYLEEGITGNITMPKVTDKSFKEAKELLEKAGFVRITYRTPRNATIWEPENWTVISQNVEPGEAADKNVEIILSCEKPGYQFEEKTDTTEDTLIETTEIGPTVATEKPTTAEPSKNESAKSNTKKLDEFMEFVRASVAEDDKIQVEVKRYLDTVYLDITMDGMTEIARQVAAYGGDYRIQWDNSMEQLKALNQQYREVMIKNYGLNKYNFSLCLMNDEDPDYVLVEFVNGEMKRSVVE